LTELFNRLDFAREGEVKVEDVCMALGDVVNFEALRADFPNGKLSYDDFHWVMTMPRLGPTNLGFCQLLGACSGLISSWKVSQTAAKAKGVEDKVTIEAKRRENMSWRLWKKQLAAEGGLPETLEDPARPSAPALSVASVLRSRGLQATEDLVQMTREERRSAIIRFLVERGLRSAKQCQGMSNAELQDLAFRKSADSSDKRGQQTGLFRASTRDLVTSVMSNGASANQADWSFAAITAKAGSVDAARRENMIWRKFNMSMQVQRAVSRCS